MPTSGISTQRRQERRRRASPRSRSRTGARPPFPTPRRSAPRAAARTGATVPSSSTGAATSTRTPTASRRRRPRRSSPARRPTCAGTARPTNGTAASSSRRAEHERGRAPRRSGCGRRGGRRASSRPTARRARSAIVFAHTIVEAPKYGASRRAAAISAPSDGRADDEDHELERGRRMRPRVRRSFRPDAALACHPMTTAELAALDRSVLWHPFTQQQGWSRRSRVIIERAEGDDALRHRRATPTSTASRRCGATSTATATRRSTRRSARSSTASRTRRCSASRTRPAIELARRLRRHRAATGSSRVFYSDNGSTAVGGRAEDGLPVAGGIAGEPQRDRLRLPARRPTTATRSARSRSAASTSSTHHYGPLLFEAWQAEPGDAGDMAALLRGARRPGGRGDRRAARAGRRRDARAPRGLPARGARAVRRPRRAAHLRRGRDGLRPHRHDVRVRARGRRARPDVPGQGHHRRLPAARRDADDRAHLRGLPRPLRGVQDVLPRPHVHRQPAGLRGRARDARRVRAASRHARAPCSRRSRCCGTCSARWVEPLATVARCAVAGS